jgi:16S rRNA (cytosine1402-N4)-methyltransferase
MTDPAVHIPVLCDAVVAALEPKDGAIYVDGTFGAGGYSSAILDAARCAVIGIDRDPDAIRRGQALKERHGERLTLIEGPFGAMAAHLGGLGITEIDGVTLDLGVSSPQLDQADRGFSFRLDGPLDMRMAQSGESAADLVASLPEKALADIIYRYGEERHSRRVARAIVHARAEAAITRTGALADIVRRAVPRSADGIDPATRTFQALRIAVNDELGELERGLEAAETMLKPGGRLAVVSFHSLEDRQVKAFLAARSGTGAGTSRHAPADLRRRHVPSFRLIGRRATRASEAEIQRNPRARSARLRTAERLDQEHQTGAL